MRPQKLVPCSPVPVFRFASGLFCIALLQASFPTTNFSHPGRRFAPDVALHTAGEGGKRPQGREAAMRGAGSRGRLPLAVVLCVLSLGGRGKRRAPSALAH